MYVYQETYDETLRSSVITIPHHLSRSAAYVQHDFLMQQQLHVYQRDKEFNANILLLCAYHHDYVELVAFTSEKVMCACNIDTLLCLHLPRVSGYPVS